MIDPRPFWWRWQEAARDHAHIDPPSGYYCASCGKNYSERMRKEFLVGEVVCCFSPSPIASVQSLEQRDTWIQNMNEAETAWLLGQDG